MREGRKAPPAKSEKALHTVLNFKTCDIAVSEKG